jgi:hypothetical protein
MNPKKCGKETLTTPNFCTCLPFPCSQLPDNGHYGRLHRSTENNRGKINLKRRCKKGGIDDSNLEFLGSNLSWYTRLP